MLCFAKIIQETCNASAADNNVLRTITYNEYEIIPHEFLPEIPDEYSTTSCAIGQCICFFFRMHKNYTTSC